MFQVVNTSWSCLSLSSYGNWTMWRYKLGEFYLTVLVTLHLRHFNINLTSKPLLMGFGAPTHLALLYMKPFSMALCSYPSSGMFFSFGFFFPDGLYPPVKLQFGMFSFLPTTLGSHFFLTYLYFLQRKYFLYSLPVLMMAHKNTQQQ